MQEVDESGRSVLEFLSFEAGGTFLDPQDTAKTMPVTPFRSTPSNAAIPMQGVLWKRRDVFRNRWRPRWFVLHPDQRVLTYYLLSHQDAEGPQQVVSGAGSTSSLSTPSRRGSFRSSSNNSYTTPSTTVHMGSPSTVPPQSAISNRRRTFSESSAVSTNTIDCDVVPRGTIYLLGSTVEANEALTRPHEDLYALTITDHETATHCHLAARDPETRDQWIVQIRRVCKAEGPVDGSPAVAGVTPTRSMRRKRKGRTPASPPSSTPNRNGSRLPPSIAESAQINGNHPKPVSDDSGTSDATIGSAQPPLMVETPVPKNSNSVREKEILILLGPLVLYTCLSMISLTRLAALTFAVSSLLVIRWILIENLSKVVQFLPEPSEGKGRNGFPSGSICCRFSVQRLETVSISNQIVEAVTKAIHDQPSLASKDYPLIPAFFTMDVDLVDLEKTVVERSSLSSQSLIRYFAGPSCRIMMTAHVPANNGSEQPEIHLDMTTNDCPITVVVSQGPTKDQGEKFMVNLSISFRSTNVGACRRFTETVQEALS